MVDNSDPKVACWVLLTELAYYILAGLSEEARADFRVMKDVAIYTRVSPESRMKSLGMFMRDLQRYTQQEDTCQSYILHIVTKACHRKLRHKVDKDRTIFAPTQTAVWL